MKKYTIPLSVLLALLIAISAWSAGKQTAAIRPTLAFREEQVICGLSVTADTEEKVMYAVIRLWEDGKCVKTWHRTGEGSLRFSESVPAVVGSTYCLTVRVNINGQRLPRMSVENVYQ